MRGHSGAVSRNLRVTFEALAGHSDQGAVEAFGPITAVSAGVPTATFNRVFVFEPFEPADLTAAVDWFTDRGDPFWVTTLDALVDPVEVALDHLDCETSDPPQPGMARDLPGDLPAPDTAADIAAVTDTGGLDAWRSVAASVFEFSAATNRLITPASVLEDEDLLYLVGWVDDQPAACGLLGLDGSVAGVYVIGVDEEFRRRGIGEAMTWAVLREGRDRGAEVGVLQSTQMGYPLYQEMGFETEVEFRHVATEDWL